MQTESEQHDATVTSPASDPIIDLGRGLSAPLSEILSEHNPHCRFCSGGVQLYTEGGSPRERLCGCAVRGIVRKLRGDDPIASVVVKGNERYLEHRRKQSEGKLAKLQRLRDATAEEYSERMKGADDGIKEAHACMLASEETLECERERGRKAVAELDEAKAEVARCEDAVRGQLALVALCEGRLDDKREELASEESRHAAILAQAERAGHKLKRLDDQIALHLQKHPELVK